MDTHTTHRVALLNADGTPDTSFVGAVDQNTVHSVMRDSDNNIFVGGSFTSIDGDTDASYLARLHNDGSLDTTLNIDVSYIVWTLALAPDGKIWV